MKKLSSLYRRATSLLIAGITLGAIVMPLTLFLSGNAFATTGIFEPRSITMSNSTSAATGVTYTASFQAATTSTIAGFAIDFCANDPIPTDSCTKTGNLTSFALPTAYTSFTIKVNGTAITGTWSMATSDSTTIAAVQCTASCPTVTAGQVVTIAIASVTNPTTSSWPGSFYARLFDYSTAGGVNGYTSGSPGTPNDEGGDALSTTQNISVQAKVFETLTFCVYTGSCGTAPSATLGASATEALSTSSAYGSSAVAYQLATNATNGVTVTMTGQTLCSALTLSYANCEGASTPPTIAAIGSTAVVPATGTAQFGMCANVTSFTGLTAVAPYNDTVNSCPSLTSGSALSGTGLTAKYGFNDANTSGGTNNAAGSTVLTSTGPISSNTGYFDYIADIASTTPAGIYNSNLNMVASANF